MVYVFVSTDIEPTAAARPRSNCTVQCSRIYILLIMGVVKVNAFSSDAVHLSWFPLVTFKEIDNDNASVHTQLILN